MPIGIGSKIRVVDTFRLPQHRGITGIVDYVGEFSKTLVITSDETPSRKLGFLLSDVEEVIQEELVVGTRVRMLANAPNIISHNYTDHTGTIHHFAMHSRTANITIDKCPTCQYNELYFCTKDIVAIPISLPNGYKQCKCGTITSRDNGKCCDCENKV